MPLKLKYHFLPYPQEIVDEGLKLSLGEYRLLGYLLRHEVRLGGAIVRMKQDELIRGRLLANGNRADKGCGLTSGRDLRSAREALVGRGWLEVTDTPDGMIYTLLVDRDENQAKVQDALFQEGVKVQDALSQKCVVSSAKVQDAPIYIKELEGSKRKPSPSSKEGKKTDPRYSSFVEAFHNFYEYLTEEKHGWGKSHGQQLNAFLAEHRDIDLEKFRRWLYHYSRSENINRAAKAREVLPRLHLYMNGPLDRFGKPKQQPLTVLPPSTTAIERHRRQLNEDYSRKGSL